MKQNRAGQKVSTYQVNKDLGPSCDWPAQTGGLKKKVCYVVHCTFVVCRKKKKTKNVWNQNGLKKINHKDYIRNTPNCYKFSFLKCTRNSMIEVDRHDVELKCIYLTLWLMSSKIIFDTDLQQKTCVLQAFQVKVRKSRKQFFPCIHSVLRSKKQTKK